jgi:hypothetical protein
MRPQSKSVVDESPRNLARMGERNARVLARNVSFGATMNNADRDINLDVWKASGTTPGVANTDFTIQHSLGRIPLTIVGQDTDNLGLIGRSPTTPWTKTTVTLRCSTASAHYKVILA